MQASDQGTAAAVFGKARALLGASSLLLATDFDGTVSVFVRDPWSATIIPRAQRALRSLATTSRVHVALISGRTAADLAGRVRVGGVSYRGDHGAEWAEARRGFRPASLAITREAAPRAVLAMAERLKVEVPRAIAEPWLVLEDKGSALAFHFRTAPDVDAARTRIEGLVAAIDRDGLLVRSGGRRDLELRPAGSSNKGDALGRLIEEHRPGAVIMLGDDPNDAIAFDELRRARAAGHVDGLAIAVAGRPEVLAAVRPHADLVLSGPHETAMLLAMLARAASGRS